MLLPWIIFVLAVFVFLICFSILRFQSLQVGKRAEALQDALWARRNRIPLLLEIIKRAGEKYPRRDEMIQLRKKVLSEAYQLEEQMSFEKQLSENIGEIFRKFENQSDLKSDSLYISLQKELNELLESIRIAINDYNFELQKWQKYIRLPWFKIFEFGFEIRRNKPLGPV